MVLRKTRSSTMGKSSTDIRSAIETKPERKERLPLYATAYPYHEAQLNLPRVKTLTTLPTDATPPPTELFKSSKPIILRPSLIRPKSSALSGSDMRFFSNSPKILTEEQPVSQTTPKPELHLLPPTTQPLLNKVDLCKVAEIRKTLRRRYGNRNDFRKIFKHWDESSLGVLSVNDIHKMVNRIGIAINLNEARVLVASVNKSRSGALNLNEFMGLIFENDDKLDVDLNLLTDEDLNENLQSSSLSKHAENLRNNLKGCLKENIFGLASQFSRADKRRKGKVSYEEFVSIMNNMDLPPHLSSEKTLKLLFGKAAEEHVVDYKVFLDEVEAFVPVDEPVNAFEKPAVQPIKESVKVLRRDSPEREPVVKLSVMDRQKVPVNQLENIFVKAKRIRLLLRNCVQTQDKLLNGLFEKGSGKLITFESLAEFVVDKLQEKESMKITRKELEGFLSTFIYNKDGVTSIEDVAKSVFLEDTKAFQELQLVKRAVPPARPASSYDNLNNKNVKRLLNAIEEKFYTQGSQKARDVFRRFDSDKDGYITQDDLEKALELNQIVHTAKDVKDLMGFLDTGRKGFITFSDFSSIVRPNIVTANKERLFENPSDHAESLQPSLEFLNAQKRKLSEFFNEKQRLVNEFRPDEKAAKVYSSTRYGSNPPHQDTFVNFYTPLSHAQSEQNVVQKRFVAINVGGEEKTKKMMMEEQRIRVLKKIRDERALKVAQLEANFLERDQKRVLQKSAVLEDYERKCKQGAPFGNTLIE